MNRQGPSPKRKWQAVIELFLKEPTITKQAAAAKLGIAYSTLKGWLRQPAYQEAEREARKEIWAQVGMQLVAGLSESVETLRRNQSCEEPGTEVRAADLFIENARKTWELLDIAQEVETLKQQVAESKNAHSNGRARSSQAANSGSGIRPDNGGTAGSASGGSGGDLCGSSDDPRPLASEPFTGGFEADATSLRSPSG
jgi:hypothetical protein